MALLTSGGLLLETLQHLRNTDLGMQSEKVLTFETPLFRYQDFDRRVAFVNAELESIRAIPGVLHAGAISRIPLTVNDQATFYLLAGQSLAGQSRDPIPGQVAFFRVVTRDYFQTIGARLREGRFFEISDRRSESPVVIVNAFALLALLLASVGLYGVLSYAVAQRTNEIGARMALGATSSEILLSFGKRGLALTLTGLAIGVVLAAIGSRLLTTLLYGFRPDYIPTVAAVSVIFAGVAALACFVPARRASRVDPVIALRNE